jgi:oxygen-independent coproporphyrinogen-3 oxidase
MDLGVYVHIPFCISKCRYCDFNSAVADESVRSRYPAQVKAELIRRLKHLDDARIRTVYFGGGTPTTYSPVELSDVLATIRTFNLAADAEISIEANPDTLDRTDPDDLRDAGFNRISIGVQSLDDTELDLLGRTHSARGAVEAVRAARRAFDSLSLDLISCLPGQTLDDWLRTLDRALELSPDHISAYGLMLERGTPLLGDIEAGKLPWPDEETCADIYEATHETLCGAGYEHYEISSYARPGMECRHNQVYWRNQPYLGCGAGAASYLEGVRMMNLADPAEYMVAIRGGDGAVESRERLSPSERASESIMLGLRTGEGVDLGVLSKETGVELEKKYAQQIARLVREGLAIRERGRLRLTAPRGFALHSEIAGRFF